MAETRSGGRILNRLVRQQGGPFQQPAEILFAGVLMRAVGEPKIGGGLVTDLEPLEVDDADVLFATFPDLALLQFHGWESISLDLHFKRDGGAAGYFFLPAACLLATTAFFFAARPSLLLCFWPDFFWFAFGDLSPMMCLLSTSAVN